MFELIQWILYYAAGTLWVVQQVTLPVLDALGLFEQAELVQVVTQRMLHGHPGRPDLVRDLMLYIMDEMSQIGTPSGMLP